MGGEIPADAPKVKRGTRLPEDWFLPKAWGEWATENFHVSADQVRSEAERFKNYWLAKAGREAIKLDWSRTWQNWCANDLKGWRRRVIPTGHGGELFSTPYVPTPEPAPPTRPIHRTAVDERIAKARALMSPEARAAAEANDRKRIAQ